MHGAEPSPPPFMPSQPFEEEFAIVTMLANTRKDPASALIHTAHHSDLGVLLVVVGLIDAYSIDPDIAAAPLPPRLLEDVLAVATHLHHHAIDQHRRKLVRVPPCVRYGVVDWCPCDWPCRELAVDTHLACLVHAGDLE